MPQMPCVVGIVANINSMAIAWGELEMTVQTSIQLESFEFTLADIHTVELEQLHNLSVGVGWPHRFEDLRFLLAHGSGFAAVDAIGRVLGSAMSFPMGEDFSTIGMVITSPRLQTQGTGRWLMDHVLESVKGRRLGLNSTRAAKRLYGSIGFTIEATVYQCQGPAKSVDPTDILPPSTHLRTITADDLDEIIALDQRAYRANRAVWLSHLLPLSKGLALIRNNKIIAYSLNRPFGRGHVIGPIVASSNEEAIAVTRPHIASHEGRFLRIDTRQESGAFAEFIRQSGLELFDTVTTMSMYGQLLDPDQENSHDVKIFGLMSQTLG
jgi:ribosomal protein S18 acetylase RimI-like enzyme